MHMSDAVQRSRHPPRSTVGERGGEWIWLKGGWLGAGYLGFAEGCVGTAAPEDGCCAAAESIPGGERKEDTEVTITAACCVTSGMVVYVCIYVCVPHVVIYHVY